MRPEQAAEDELRREAGEPATEPAFEQALRRLEGVVEKLEAGESSLAEALRLFEEGVGLVRILNRQLEQAELRIRELREQLDGSVVAVPFEATGAGDHEGGRGGGQGQGSGQGGVPGEVPGDGQAEAGRGRGEVDEEDE